MSDNKLFKALFVGTLTLTSLFPNRLAEAKSNIQNELIAQSQKEPTLGEDLKRYGGKIKKTIQRSGRNIKERYIDYTLREAESCKRTESKTLRCKDIIKKARELNK